MKMNKSVKVLQKIFLATLILGIVLIGHGNNAYAQTATISTASANVREEADTASGVVKAVSNGTEVTIEQETEGADGLIWYYVSLSDGQNGYIRSDLVSTSSTTNDGSIGTALSDSARIRSESSTESDIVATVGRGTDLHIEGEETGADNMLWYQISFEYDGDTINGFIRSDLITFDALPEETPSTTEITGSIGGDSESESSEEEVPEEPEAEETPEVEVEEPETTTSAGYELVSIEGNPIVPNGYVEVELAWNGQEIRAWKNGDFFIFYAIQPDGNQGLVRYDSVNDVYQRYEESEVVEAGVFGNTIANIIMILLIIALSAVIAAYILLYTKYHEREVEAQFAHRRDQDEARREKAKNTWKSLNFLMEEEESQSKEEEDHFTTEEDDDYVDYEAKKIPKQTPVRRVEPGKKVQTVRAKAPVNAPVRRASNPQPIPVATKHTPIKKDNPQETQKELNKPKKNDMASQMINDMEFIDIDSL